MTAVVIDDQEKIRKGLISMLQYYCPRVTVVAEANGVASGLDVIAKYSPDLVFLDIEMNDGSGFDLIRQLEKRDFSLIFVTAHDQYALEAFRMSALDYLLKPINKDDLINAVERAALQRSKTDLSNQLSVLVDNLEAKPKKLILKDAESIHVVPLESIIRCAAESSYTIFYLRDGRKVVVTRTLKEFDQTLNPYGFQRIHHSHLVNLEDIQRFDKANHQEVVLINGDKLPVSHRKKEQLIARLEGLGL